MKRRESAVARGRQGEAIAAAHLTALGYRILEQNVRFRFGEIDIVAEEGGYLVFVEVKTRSSHLYGTAAEAVTPSKQRQLVRLASLYVARSERERLPCRFDVVTVEPGADGTWRCTVIPDAFVIS